MISILAIFALTGALLIAWGGRLGRRAFLVGALPPALSTVWTLAHLDAVVGGRAITQTWSWVGGLGLSLGLRLDGLAATMTLIVAGIGVLVLVYASRYFSPASADRGRLAGLLVLFAGAMVGLVQADHLLALYVCWELTSITSYLLIGNSYTDPKARAAALHALLVTTAGGLAMLGGFVLLAHHAGTYRLSELLTGPVPAGPAVNVALVLVLAGAVTKSAQYPFHAWLPDAMVAPTPVSAYLHSAAMVKAGVYLVARLAPAFASAPVWRPLVLTVGAATLLAGGLRALRRYDLKLLLAFGTVSQLGLLVVLFGAGTPDATTAGWVLLVAHSLFKAALFMVVGILDHQAGTRDLRALPPLGRSWRGVEAVSLVVAASMAGVPLAAGFVAKESAYAALLDSPFAGGWVLLGAVVGGSALTAAYAVRFHWGAFVAPRRRWAGPSPATVSPPGWAFVAPAAALAIASLVLGVLPSTADDLVSASVGRSVHLALWHGLNWALVLSVVALGAGTLLAVRDRWVQRLLATGSEIPSGDEVYLGLLRWLATAARRVTGVVQSGSLPVYAGVILATAAVVPAAALATAWEWPGWPAMGRVGDVPVLGMLVVAALGAATVRQRFAAALFLGGTGYAMAGLFVVSGAPDLALTQVAVETLSTVVFVLVLRRLPDRFEPQSTPRRRILRYAIAGLVGLAVFVFALAAAGHRVAPPISGEMVTRSVPDGEGRNVVNVILVDFRGLDTLGEITVLAAASIGAVALARAGRRPADRRRGAPGAEDELRRLVFVDVSVQVIFYAVVMTSLWLLFAGHNQPGGGFVGGLLAGSAITLRYVAGGIGEVRARSRFRPWTVLGAGLLVAAGTAAAPLLAGGAVLEVASGSLSLPLGVTAKLSTALLFDAGVYVAVLGVVLMAFDAFGDEPAGDEPVEARV